MRAIYALVLATSSLLAGTVCAEADTLNLTLKGVRNATGHLRVSVYREQDSFRKEAQAFRFVSVPATEGDVPISLTRLPAGRYAVMAYHDENANEKLDLRFGMIPVEGYALSNNPKVIGPPSFADSAFTHDRNSQPTTLIIRY